MAPRPVVTASTNRLYGRLPLAYREVDEQGNWDLLRYLSLLGDQYQTKIETVETRIVAGELTSHALADPAWLPWLSWVAGVLMPAGATLAEQRSMPVTTYARDVGTITYIAERAKRYLSGTKYILLTPKDQTIVVPSVELGWDDTGSGWDDPLHGLDDGGLSTAAAPANWQIRVTTKTGETPANFFTLIDHLRPAGYRFVQQLIP